MIRARPLPSGRLTCPMLEPRIQQHFFESADLSYQAAEAMARPIADAAQAIVDCVTAGGRLWVHGRGVAQAPAQLLGAALSGRFERERPGLAAMVLAVDPLLLSEPRASEADAPAVTQLRVLGQAGALALEAAGQRRAQQQRGCLRGAAAVDPDAAARGDAVDDGLGGVGDGSCHRLGGLVAEVGAFEEVLLDAGFEHEGGPVAVESEAARG